MNLLFVIQNMKIGGVQKSLLNVTNELLNRGNEVDYLVIDSDGELIDSIDKKVKILKTTSVKQRVARLYQKTLKEVIKDFKINDILIKISLSLIKKVGFTRFISSFVLGNIEISDKYDAIISFDGMPGIADEFVANLKVEKIKAVWIHNDIKHFDISLNKLKCHYSRFEKIGVVSEACRESFIDLFPELDERIYTVYNTFNAKEIIEKSLYENPYNEEKKVKFVIVSRMYNEAKRIDRIINAVADLKKEGYNNYLVYILGDGPSLNYYKQLTIKNEVEDVIVFMGNKTNPYPFIRYANMFVMSSEFEGYPMTLRESLILGTPCITTNFSSSNEVINDKKTGIITERSKRGIYNSMKYIIDNENIIKEYEENIKMTDLTNELAIKQLYKMLEFKLG